MFEDIKEELTRNFRELKLWTSNIDNDNGYSVSTKGLFFVYVYGLYEEIIKRVVSKTINELNTEEITIDQCIFELYTLIFSGEYDALYNVGRDHKWEKRWKIAEKLNLNNPIMLPNELFPTDGKNIRYKQLESIAKSFGLKEDILPRAELGGYIREMVDNRNDISHGNKLPKEVGGRYTIEDLLKICEYIAEVCSYIIEVYEKYISEKQYLRDS